MAGNNDPQSASNPRVLVNRADWLAPNRGENVFMAIARGQMLVVYNEWQMACCGEPFSVGDSVAWTITADPEGGEYFARLSDPRMSATQVFREDHHGDLADDWPITRGVVRRIQTLSVLMELDPDEPDGRTYRWKAGSEVVRDITAAPREVAPDPVAPNIDADPFRFRVMPTAFESIPPQGLQLMDYLVTLEVSPA